MADNVLASWLVTGYRPPKAEFKGVEVEKKSVSILAARKKEKSLFCLRFVFFLFSPLLQNALHPLSFFPIPMLACLPAVSRQFRHGKYISELIMESCIRHQVLLVARMPFRLSVCLLCFFFFFSISISIFSFFFFYLSTISYLSIHPTIHHQTTQLQSISIMIPGTMSAPSTSNISPAIEGKRDLSE